MQHADASQEVITLRTDVVPGDLGSIVRLHGVVYAQEYGFDITLEAYVAGPLAEFFRCFTDRNRLWIAERGDRLVGCIAYCGHLGKGSLVALVPGRSLGPRTGAGQEVITGGDGVLSEPRLRDRLLVDG